LTGTQLASSREFVNSLIQRCLCAIQDFINRFIIPTAWLGFSENTAMRVLLPAPGANRDLSTTGRHSSMLVSRGPILMPIQFSCACGQRFRVQETAAGKRAKCPKCGNIVVVPQPAVPDAAASDEIADRSSPPSRANTVPPSAQPGKKTSGKAPAPREKPTKKDRSSLGDKSLQLAQQRYQHISEKPTTNLLDYGYWLLPLAFIPLAFSLMLADKQSTVDRIMRSLEKSLPAKQEPVDSKRALGHRDKKSGRIVYEDPEEPPITLDELITSLPGGQVEGAFLPRKTVMHWVFAGLTAIVFFVLILILAPGAGPARHVLVIGLFTATVGILLLLVVQFLAAVTQGHILISLTL
jgi:protease PrsW